MAALTGFFRAVFSLHYLAVLAVVAPFFGAALMMLVGTWDTVEAYRLFFGFQEAEGAIEGGEAAMIKLVASVDHFLFATVLIIFAVGLYSLFFKRRLGGEEEANAPISWKQLKGMGGMDELLLKVIIMLLAVSFLEFVLYTGMGTLEWPSLVVPLTIVALAIGLRWMSAAAEEEDPVQKREERRAADLDALERLSRLHEQGALSDEEFASSKQRLLEA